jgi:hypothetical protein
LNNQIGFIQKDLDIFLDRRKNINLVCDQVSGWSNRVINKLSSQLDMPKPNMEGQQMSDVFKSISGLVCGQLENIIKENAKRSAEGSEYNMAEDYNNKDMVGEITTEEFITKNIRVRPISGITTVEKDEKQSDVHTGKGLMEGGMGAPIMDEEEKFNANVNIDMEEQRQRVKNVKK